MNQGFKPDRALLEASAATESCAAEAIAGLEDLALAIAGESLGISEGVAGSELAAPGAKL
jgi:hypothetical protein